MDIGKDLKEEIKKFISKETYVNFSFIDFNYGERYDKIQCEWLNSEISISGNGSFRSEIKNNEASETKKIEALINQKIVLIKNDSKKEFFVDIYLHQNNNFYIIINFESNKSYSLDTIYYSKNSNLIPSELNFNNNVLSLENYNIDNMKRICLININKDTCVNFINKISNLKFNGKEKIFDNKCCDIFLNIRIKNKESLECSIFLNQESEKGYLLKEQDLKILNDYYNNIINNYIKKYKNFRMKDITVDIERNFSNFIKDFTSKNVLGNSYKNIYNLDIETIPIINEEDEIMNDIVETKKKNGEKFNEINLNINEKNNQKNLLKLQTLERNFFNSPLHQKYLNKPIKRDLEAIEKMCFLSLSLADIIPLKFIIFFNRVKNEILNQIKEFSIKEKI